MNAARWEACGHLVRTVRNADGSGGFLVAECPVTSPDRAEHALLIAAAPDLLAALQAALTYLEAYARTRPDPAAPLPALDAARAAIAKTAGGAA